VAKTTASKLVNRLRDDLQDNAEPYLWSEKELLRYIDEGQIMFCRQGLPIVDSRSPLCTVDVKQGEFEIPYDDRILRLRQVISVEQVNDTYVRHREVRLHTQESFFELAPFYSQSNDYGRLKQGTEIAFQPGPVQDVLLDYDADRIRLSRPADRAYTLLLTVERLPLEEVDDCDVEIEVKRMHHPAILAWAAYMAFMRQDSETFDEAAGERFQSLFQYLIGIAQGEHQRRNNTPGRVQYGGI
jgi:hypothetical protein